jgi:para-nitrobenzyl esterase
MFLLQQQAPTVANYEMAVRAQFGPRADEVLRHYAVTCDADVVDVATDLSSDLFIGYSTWKWADAHARTGRNPVYRYLYAHPRPPMRAEMGDAVSGLAGGVIRGEEAKSQPQLTVKGAVHSADIEYFMGNLATNPVYAWTADDVQVSETMQRIYINFVTHGSPNGTGVPEWQALDVDQVGRFMRIGVNSAMEHDGHQARYRFLDDLLDGGMRGV